MPRKPSYLRSKTHSGSSNGSLLRIGAMGWTPGSTYLSSAQQRDPPRAARRGLDAGHELGPCRSAAAAFVVHAGDWPRGTTGGEAEQPGQFAAFSDKTVWM